jgi:hypothetical protein
LPLSQFAAHLFSSHVGREGVLLYILLVCTHKAVAKPTNVFKTFNLFKHLKRFMFFLQEKSPFYVPFLQAPFPARWEGYLNPSLTIFTT